jgi:hypothetical protein
MGYKYAVGIRRLRNSGIAAVEDGDIRVAHIARCGYNVETPDESSKTTALKKTNVPHIFEPPIPHRFQHKRTDRFDQKRIQSRVARLHLKPGKRKRRKGSCYQQHARPCAYLGRSIAGCFGFRSYEIR